MFFSFFFFFFSSRRRHTRFDCDWSSDVCSSDLLRCRVRTDPGTFVLLLAVKRPNGAIVHSSRSAFSQAADGARRPVRTLATGIPASSLPPGTYQIAVAVTDAKGVPLATRENAAVLDRSTPIS